MPRLVLVPLCAVLLMPADVDADDVTESLVRISQVGPRGAGHAEAAAALSRLQTASPEQLPRILSALDEATPLTANWLRGAFEAIADRAVRSGRPLPLAVLEQFVRDRSHAPQARRLAYEWLAAADPTAPDRIIPEMIDDPSAEMRRDAVERLITQAQRAHEAGDARQALTLYRQALTGASDGDQVETLAQAIARLDQPVDLVRHFALMTRWHVIGPFDNREKIGFAAIYPPEQELDLEAEYEGQLGPVRWQELEAPESAPTAGIDEIGRFDLAQLTAPHKGAVSYAAAEFTSPRDQSVEFRMATPNAWKLWINGEFVFGQEEYHRGMMFDQYVVRGHLKQGPNRILLKICQDEQPYDWAQTWAFQFRVCDLTGKGLVSADGRTAANTSGQ